MGPLPGPVQHKSDQNPDFCHEHALTPTHTHTFRTQCKVLRELPKTYQQSFWQKIRLFKQNPDQIRTNFLKKVRIRTKVRKIGPNWRDCLQLQPARNLVSKQISAVPELNHIVMGWGKWNSEKMKLRIFWESSSDEIKNCQLLPFGSFQGYRGSYVLAFHQTCSPHREPREQGEGS